MGCPEQICHHGALTVPRAPEQLQETTQLNSSTCWFDLDSRTLIRISGRDTSTFLQGQLTQDMAALGPDRALWAAHCSPKGRVLATFLTWQTTGTYWLCTPQNVADSIVRRLRMYVLRSQVSVEPMGSITPCIGICGPTGDDFWQSMGWPVLPLPGHHATVLEVMRVVLSPERVLLAGTPDAMSALKMHCSTAMASGSPQCWTDAAVREGIFEVDSTAQDEWVPQMVNWDLIGGISFKKGCYTGQEIVARTHFLGKVKRRLLRFRTTGTPESGQSLFSHDPGTAPVGKVVQTGQVDSRGTELLAVVHLDALPSAPLHLESAHGPALELLPFPYDVPLD